MSTEQAKQTAEQWMDTTDRIDWKSREPFTSRELSLAFLAGAEWMREQCAQIVEGQSLSMSSLHNIGWQDARQRIAEQIRAGGA